MFAILLHIYYKDSWDHHFREKLLALRNKPFLLLINLSIDMEDNRSVIKDIKNDFPQAIIIETPNIGKDIGGKLALIDLFLAMGLETDYLVLLHDKKSPQAITGDRWRDLLLRIIAPDTIDSIIDIFEKNDRIGLIGSREFIVDEYAKDNRSRNNGELALDLAASYGISTSDHRFIGGTMFWIRTSIFKAFFSRHKPLLCRAQLESGNVLDIKTASYTHSWERLFCWIVTAGAYKIKGV